MDVYIILLIVASIALVVFLIACMSATYVLIKEYLDLHRYYLNTKLKTSVTSSQLSNKTAQLSNVVSDIQSTDKQLQDEEHHPHRHHNHQHHQSSFPKLSPQPFKNNDKSSSIPSAAVSIIRVWYIIFKNVWRNQNRNLFTH